ncbi:hypothetical protein LZ32DRAFT_301605 [Colletotrichum eremochloae]|nr:hypothetical protein LZ32DRAFT_301605 [Colletotrichum eremochloae]
MLLLPSWLMFARVIPVTLTRSNPSAAQSLAPFLQALPGGRYLDLFESSWPGFVPQLPLSNARHSHPRISGSSKKTKERVPLLNAPTHTLLLPFTMYCRRTPKAGSDDQKETIENPPTVSVGPRRPSPPPEPCIAYGYEMVQMSSCPQWGVGTGVSGLGQIIRRPMLPCSSKN